jgi:hypothetical protein
VRFQRCWFNGCRDKLFLSRDGRSQFMNIFILWWLQTVGSWIARAPSSELSSSLDEELHHVMKVPSVREGFSVFVQPIPWASQNSFFISIVWSPASASSVPSSQIEPEKGRRVAQAL